ncbi:MULTISPECIES: hypothetical protein [Cupriavidus]|uniref:Uncharacterized protein n=1 Tax=Cupriavidus basilensis TaxID=68895 RepID=A0A7M2H9P7_9BURK|nr:MULTISPECIES: hypothetical protein [Cupriavidus]QOT81593.1 hypothetical protein F7R26_036840 [Cupriavidus basilensis]BDB30206.1 hypothetical protein CTP10_R76230 [Cupriavidus sp. P-10]
MRSGKLQNGFKHRPEEQFPAAILEATLLPSSLNRRAGGAAAGKKSCKLT